MDKNTARYSGLISTQMAIFPLRSKQQKQVPDVYIYNSFPSPFRVQVVHIWRDTLGDMSEYRDRYRGTEVRSAYRQIVEALCREYGVFSLRERSYEWSYLDELENFFLTESDPERLLDTIQITFQYIDLLTRSVDYLSRGNADQYADDAIEELNHRFKEHGLGYQYANKQIIRVDSEFVHAEVIKPALALLHAKQFFGAEAEFLKAHEHYRHGRYKETLTESCKALESTLKVICDKRKWAYDKSKDTSKKLIEICFENGLIP